ncbi:MAG: hypothetical protein AAFZ65_19835, partial [Planctomycetota bacterium]
GDGAALAVLERASPAESAPNGARRPVSSVRVWRLDGVSGAVDPWGTYAAEAGQQIVDLVVGEPGVVVRTEAAADPEASAPRETAVSDGRRLFLATDRGELLDLTLSDSGAFAPAQTRASLHRRQERAVVFGLRQALAGAGALTGTSLRLLLPDDAAPLAQIGALALSPDGGLLAVGFEDGRIELWNTTEMGEPLALRSNVESVLDLAFDPRGERLVSGAQDGSVRVFELDLGEQVLRPADHPAPAAAVAFSPSGQDLLSLDTEGELRISTSAALAPRFEERRAADQLRRLARTHLIGVLEGTMRATEVLTLIDSDRDLDPQLRSRIRAYVRFCGEDAARLESDAWAVVQGPDHQPDEYEDAYLWALFADYLEPDQAVYLRTLGTAHFRLGRHKQAIETLDRAVELHRGRAFAEELAVLAMAHAALGDEDAARQCQSELELITQSSFYARDQVARAFRNEVRAALGPLSAELGSPRRGGR